MTSPLPFVALSRALRPTPSAARFIRLARLRGRLLTTKPSATHEAAIGWARIIEGKDPSPTTVAELALELASLSDDARGLACILAPSLEPSGEDAAAAHEALGDIGVACARALGAAVPASVIVDATIFETLRAIAMSWGPDRLVAGETERAEELARRILRALGLAVAVSTGTETNEVSEARIRELDAESFAMKQRSAAIEAKVRAGLKA